MERWKMTAKALKQGARSAAKQPWLEQAFAEHWRERLTQDMARPKFKPKPKKTRKPKR